MAWLNRLDAAIARSLGGEANVNNAVEEPEASPTTLADSSAVEPTNLSATEHETLTAQLQGSQSDDEVTEPVDEVNNTQAPTNATHDWIPEVAAAESTGAGMSFAECCAVCYDAWPPADGTVSKATAADIAPSAVSSSVSMVVAATTSKQLKCQRCHRRCHRACCDFAARVLPCDTTCDESLPPPLPEGANRPGYLSVQVLAASVETSTISGGALAEARRVRVRANARLLPAPLHGDSEQWISAETEAAAENGVFRASWDSTGDFTGVARGTLHHGNTTAAGAAAASSSNLGASVGLPEPTLRVVLEACHTDSSATSSPSDNNSEVQLASDLDDAWTPLGAPVDLPLMPLLGCPGHELRRWFANYDGQGSTQADFLLTFEPTTPSVKDSVEDKITAVAAIASSAPALPASDPADSDAVAFVADAPPDAPSSNEAAPLQPPLPSLPPASPLQEKPLPSPGTDTPAAVRLAPAPGSPPFSPMSGHHHGHSSGLGGGSHEPHWFRVTTLKKPGWCALCSRLLVGVWRQGHACERCGLLVHRTCQQQAHLDLPCGSQLSTAAAVTANAAASNDVNDNTNDGNSSSKLNENESADGSVHTTADSIAAGHNANAYGGGGAPMANTEPSPRRQLFSASDDGNGNAHKSSSSREDVTSADTMKQHVAPSGNLWSGIGEVSLEVVCAHQCSSRCDAPFSWLASARHARHLGLTSAFVSPRRCQAVVQEAQAAAARNLLQPNGHARPPAAAADFARNVTSDGGASAPSTAAGAGAPNNNNDNASTAAAAAATAAEVTAAATAMDLAHGIPNHCACPGSDLFLRFYMGGQEAGRTATTYGKRTCRPQRNERQRHFAAPHGKATFAVHLIDAATDQAVRETSDNHTERKCEVFPLRLCCAFMILFSHECKSVICFNLSYSFCWARNVRLFLSLRYFYFFQFSSSSLFYYSGGRV